ncbi:DUF4179 domain-containing protein [Paenibacillus ginsengarvi]|uniref:DUF4179 domain-containing protein n=1 Tax=Paenibacillus ginsengarvi TaxID=400777 RepID=A0A3B0CJH9_9BACL|nr:DUF4179 domain-containing protein [Paenibacillus ginsengarvi]RKN85170.1 DUF4179 domain-containing protein [Paenibacillus ginsengarvi]
MKQETEMRLRLKKALEDIPVPESLFRFAEELPDKFEKGEFVDRPTVAAPRRIRRRRLPVLYKSAAAALLVIATLTAGVKVSPAFASFVKGVPVPGFELAVDWLTQVRERDGVQTALNNGYTPIAPVTWQTGGTVITISDIYLTDEELLFKSFIASDDFDVTDPQRSVDIKIHPGNLSGSGSTTAGAIAATTDGGGKPVLQESYKFQLAAGMAEEFLQKGTELRLTVIEHTADRAARRSDWKELGQIEIPIEPGKLLHNRVLEPDSRLAIGDPDFGEMPLNKLTIQPTTMNVIVQGPKGWQFDFPRDDETAPYLKDDKGRIYRYDPSGPGLLLEDGKLQLPFSSSVFFDRDIRSLTLYIGKMTISEMEPSGRVELAMDEAFPKSVRFKNRELVIEGADYDSRGYLHLKMKKDRPGQTSLEGVSFDIAEKEDLSGEWEQERLEAYIRKTKEDREAFLVSGFGIAEDYLNKPHLDVYIPAPRLERYTIELSRSGDTIDVGRSYPIAIKP